MAARFSTSDLGRTLRDTANPCFALDYAGRLIFVNSAVTKLLKTTEADLLGKHVHFSSEGATPDEALINRLAPPPEVFAGEPMSGQIVFAEDTESTLKTFCVHWLPLQGETNDTVAVIGVMQLLIITENESPQIESKRLTWHERLMHFRAAAKNQFRLADLVGNSPAAKIAQQQAFQASKSSTSLLITGPVGIGKKALARTIHYGGSGNNEGLIEIDCSVLSSELILERISAVLSAGSTKTKTILIANIELLSTDVQSLFTKELRKQPACRIIATSSVNISTMLVKGSSMQDLLTILSTMAISLPSLAERPSDVPFYVQSIIEKENLRGGRTIRGCTRDAFERIASYSWPGQLTELHAALAEAREKSAGHEITADDLPDYLTQAEMKAMYPASKPAESIDLEKTLATVERELIARALSSAKGNKTAAAQLVGMSRPRFYRRLVEVGLVDEESTKKPPSPSTSTNTKSSSKSKARDVARKRKNRKPTPFDNLPEVLSASSGDPDFIDDIPFIPTDESNEDEE